MPNVASRKSFRAQLERSGNSLNWVVVRIPFDVAKSWGTRGQIRVRGEINGYDFDASLFPNGRGGHYLVVNKQMQKGGRTGPGEEARFILAPDTSERIVTVPEELVRELRQSRVLKKFFESLNNSTRHWVTNWIASGKQVETRRRRAAQIAERLMETLEAEQELPPIIQMALAQNASAREGWERMPRGHRRAHLLGIFYYRDPESRARRLAKAVEEMVRYAERPTSPKARMRARPEK